MRKPCLQTDQAGEPLSSWRVTLGPFIEHDIDFHFDEPWNSDHNRQFSETAPAVYRCGGDISPLGETSYLAIVGANPAEQLQPILTIGQPISFADITDGTSNTLLVVERHNSGITWSEPKDIFMTAGRAAEGWPGLNLRSVHRGFENDEHPFPQQGAALLADGSVRFLSSDIDPAVVRQLILRNDDEDISGEF